MDSTSCPQRKMMGRGADGGCGTEEKPCRIYKLSHQIPSSQIQTLDPLHFYIQAQKALSEHSPFDAEEAVSRVSTLPVGLSSFLSRCTDRRRRKHKKSYPETGGTSSVQCAAPNVWGQTEEYFRHVTLADIERLVSKSDICPASDPCFSIPSVPASVGAGNVASLEAETEIRTGNCENGVEVDGLELNNGIQEMEIDSVGPNDTSLEREPTNSMGLHCLLGTKHKILLTSERPSKKRKLLSENAGLEKLVIAHPSQGGDSALCHVCYLGDSGVQSNRLLHCDSCSVSVHQKCYGVQEAPLERWFCSWCKQRDHLGSLSKPCVLCPKDGGALKPVGGDGGRIENGNNVKFAHLFCCMWVPELYVEDMEAMEPIMNVEGIKDTRKKLICFLCKVKCGVCIRCSNGACRTSFHPICAREAKLRMEIWGKFGCNDVELRAFCSKHSGPQGSRCARRQESFMPSMAVGSDSSATKLLPVPGNRVIKLKLGVKNGDKGMARDKNTYGSSGEVSKNVQVDECKVPCLTDMEMPRVTEKDGIGDANSSSSLSLVLIVKEVIDQGKTTVSAVASEMGISSDLLSATLAGEHASAPPDLYTKMAKWLQDSAHVGTTTQCLKSGINSAVSYGSKLAQTDSPNDVEVACLGGPGAVPSISLPIGRGTKSRIRILKEKKLACSSGGTCGGKNGTQITIEGINQKPPVLKEVMEDGDTSNDSSFGDRSHLSKGPEVTGKDYLNYSSHMGMGIEYGKVPVQRILGAPNSIVSGASTCMANNGSEIQQQSQFMVEKGFSIGEYRNNQNNADVDAQNYSVKSSGEWSDFAIDFATRRTPDPKKGEPTSTHIHPFIHKKLMQMQNCGIFQQKNRIPDCDGQEEKALFCMKATCSAGGDSTCIDPMHRWDAARKEQLVEARRTRILELSPEDEVEGDLIYFQHRLLDNAVSNKNHFERLIFSVAVNLSHELDALRKQRWDAVTVNQYLRGVREAKKQGRKERRHREAQAVLAAATAAAAASSRISSLRKDSHGESPPKVNVVSGRAGVGPQLIPRAKETLSRPAIPKISSELLEASQLTSDFSKEHPRSCDVCGRTEMILNQILVCGNCKVAVHLDCYNGLKDLTSPWYCEMCEELLLHSSSHKICPINTQDSSSFITQCGLCGRTSGAFRKSTDGRWVHAFCAEWVLEATYKRGQPNPVGGMEAISRERELLVCCICHCKYGVCIKCNHDGCQTVFHPTCARSTGFYMNVKTVGGKLQHKAYCEMHSLEQSKAETQQHRAEELHSMKQIRVELEKLRLLCERIIKREKVKRELVLCSHDMLASKRDSVAFSVLVRSSFFPPDLSSGSVTTSLKGHADDNKSSDAMQKSDDVTVDSTVSGTSQVTFPLLNDIDRRTDDSSTSRPSICKPTDRVPFSGKQFNCGPMSVASWDPCEEAEKISKPRKRTQTFQKEILMTSDQASIQNLRLPKGYVYIPVGSLPKEKPVNHDMQTAELLDPDG